MLHVCLPTPSSWVNDVIGETGFRKAVRLERGVGKMAVYPIAPIAEHVEKGFNMWVHWRFREEKKSGEYWSSILTMWTNEGLLAPAF